MKRAIGCLCLAVCALAVPALATASTDSLAIDSSVLISSDGVTIYADGVITLDAGEEQNAFSSCPSGMVCLWSNTGYLGEMIAFSDRGEWINLGAYDFNEDAESWRNRTSDDAKLARHGTNNPNFPGTIVCLDQYDYNNTLGSFNDDASAIRITNGAGVC